MMPKKESFLVNRFKSIGYAFKGALLLLKTEASIKIQFAIAILVTIAGFYFSNFWNRMACSNISYWFSNEC